MTALDWALTALLAAAVLTLFCLGARADAALVLASFTAGSLLASAVITLLPRLPRHRKDPL